MAKKISSKDIFDGKPLQPLIDDAQKTVIELKKLEAGLKQIAKIAKNDLKGLKLNSFSNVSKASKAVNTVDKSFKGLNETTKERIKLQGQLKRANSDSIQKNEELRLQLSAQKKANKELAKEKLGLISVYDKESKRLNKLRKELKELILTEGEGSKKTKKLAAEVGKLDTKLKNADAAAGQFQRNVGNYPKGLSKATGALKNFAGALGITAGIAGVVSVLKGAITTTKDFEKSLSSLSSITGATGKDLEFYKEQAIAIGSSTTLSASQTVEAFKLIGSAKPELLANKEALVQVTEQAIALAEAAGLELPQAAKSLTNTLNQFNLGANESGRVINALAAGSKFGAAAIPELTEAISKFGVAAKSSNITVEESIGAVELLAEKGIEGAEAGTKLRNVFGKLDLAKSLPPKAAKQLAKFGVNTDIVSDSTLTLQERLTELSKIQDDATALTFVFGEQNKIAAQAVLQNVDRVAELTEQVTGTKTAYDQAAINVDNLDGSIKSLSSAYEGLILNLLSGDGAFSTLSKGIVEGATALLQFLSASEDATEVSFETAKALRQEADESQNLLDEYESLVKDGIEPTKEEKEKLELITLKLKDRLGESVVAINKETGAFELNTAAVREQIKLKRFASDEEAATLASRLKGVKEAIKLSEFELKSQQRIIDISTKRVKENAAAENKRISDLQKQGKSSRFKLSKEAKEDVSIRNAAINEEAKLNDKIREQKEKEIDLIEKLKELNFSAADADALFAVKKKKIIEEEIELIEDLNDANKDTLRTDKEIAKAKDKAAKDAKERRDAADKKEQDRFDKHEERQQNQFDQVEAHERGIAAEKERNRLAEEEAEIAAAKAAEKRREEQFESAKKYLDLTSEAFSDAIDEEEKEQDAAIKRREESVSLQQERAANGLENTLAFEKEQLAKAELERARTAEKRAKQEEALALAQAFLNAFAARAKDDPDTAAARALSDVIVAKALSEVVAGAFAEGVEDFQGEGTGTSDSNLIRFSHGESVVTAKGTKENKGLTTAMNNGDVGGWFANNMMLTPLSKDKNYDSFGILAKEIKEIKYAIKNRPTSQTNLDNMGNVMQSTYKNGIRNTVKYVNKPGII